MPLFGLSISDIEKMKVKRDVKGLIKALGDKNASNRDWAARALGEVGDARAVGALVSVLGDPSWQVSTSAVFALEKIGGEEAINALFNALKNPNDSVRASAVASVGRIDGLRAVSWLVLALKDRYVLARLYAAEALGNIGDVKTVGALAMALKDPEESVRRTAAESFAKIGDVKVVDGLILALKDRDSIGRFEAIAILGGVGGEYVVNKLVLALRDQDVIVRQYAAEILGKICDARAIDGLALAIKDSNGDVRWKAANALGKIGGARAIDGLADALNDKDTSVHLEAARVLAELESEHKTEALVIVLRHQNSPPLVRHSAAEELAKIGDTRSVERLIDALKDSNNLVCKEAANALAKTDDAQAGDALIAILKDPNENAELRRIAVASLERRKLPRSQVLPLLYLALLDKNRSGAGEIVRITAAKAISNLELIEDDTLSHLLISLIENSDDVNVFVRKAIDRITYVSPSTKEDLGPLLPQLLVAWEKAPTTLDDFFLKTLSKIGTPPQAIDIMLKRLYEHCNDYDLQRAFKTALVAIVPVSSLTEEMINCAVNGCRDAVRESIDKLCKVNSPVSSNILHLIAKRPDLTVSMPGPCQEYDIYETQSYQYARDIASNELKRRGNPPYTIEAYRKIC